MSFKCFFQYTCCYLKVSVCSMALAPTMMLISPSCVLILSFQKPKYMFMFFSIKCQRVLNALSMHIFNQMLTSVPQWLQVEGTIPPARNLLQIPKFLCHNYHIREAANKEACREIFTYSNKLPPTASLV